MTRLIAFLVGILVLGLSMQVHAQDTLTGVYTVDGANPGGGKDYRGVVEITKTDAGYLCVWTLGKTDDGEWITAKGYGFETNQRFVVAIVSEDPGGHQSLTVAAYARDGKTLRGEWSVAPSGTVGRETLTPSTKGADALKRGLPTPDGRAL